jgi:serine phosphatase RsbU (regulator of sigma subunit)
MSGIIRSRQIWFRVFIVGGVLLGIVLLVQTVATYVYVSGNLVIDEALADAERRAMSLERSLWRVDPAEPAAVESVLADSLEDWNEAVGWLRLRSQSGDVLAESGAVAGNGLLPLDAMRPRPGEEREERYHEIRSTDPGTVLVTAVGLRTSRFPRMSGRFGQSEDDLPRPAWVEIALDLDNVSAAFSPLRRNLVIGVSAAIALLGMVLLIGLRFPQYLRGKQLEGQIELARAVQGNLLPHPVRQARDAEIAADCTPVSQVGGDFYDILDLPGGQLGLMLGDVSGKGVSAAPLMGFIHGAVHASSWTDSPRDHERATARLNDLLHRKTAMDRFVTLFWGYFDRGADRFRYVNAGHCPPLVFRAHTGGNVRVRLEDGGPVLGALPGVEYRQGEVSLDDGDLLVMCSDGILEAANAEGEEFGEARLLAPIRRHWGESPSRIRDAILGDLADFRNGTEPADDQTLVVVRFHPEQPAEQPAALAASAAV